MILLQLEDMQLEDILSSLSVTWFLSSKLQLRATLKERAVCGRGRRMMHPDLIEGHEDQGQQRLRMIHNHGKKICPRLHELAYAARITQHWTKVLVIPAHSNYRQ